MNNFNDLYREILENNNLREYISEQYAEMFKILTEEMLRVNAFMNLTAITDISEIIAAHYADCLFLSEHIPHSAKLIDIGTGAGFPLFPLAVTRADLNLTALDSTEKKLKYIKNTAQLLNLSNISVINARAEQLSNDKAYRESYDIACARAVAPLNILCEYCLPFVKLGGKFLAMKSISTDTEIDAALCAVEKLGGEMTGNVHLELVTDKEIKKRSIIIIQKNKPTPIKYPRNNAQINKNPL